MKYFLVKFYKSWADEFEAEGFTVFDEPTWNNIKDYEESHGDEEKNWSFGTNEGFEDTVHQMFRAMRATEISETEAEFLKKTFMLGDKKRFDWEKYGTYGIFPPIYNWMINPDCEDEDEDD